MRHSTAASGVKVGRPWVGVSVGIGVLAVRAAGAYDFMQPPPGLPADAVNTIQLYLADQVNYDDNLYRVPPGTVGVPLGANANDSQTDVVNSTTFGSQGRWDIGRQEVDLDLRADENRFKRNTSLDYVSANAVGTLNWHAADAFSGQVRSYYDRSLASFSETRFTGKDIITSLEELGYGRYQVGPHWAVYGQVRGSYTNHSATIAQFNDFHEKAGYVGAEYATDVNDLFALEYQYVDITFKPNVALAAGAYDYGENTEKFIVNYALSDKTSINAYVGSLQRKYPVSGVNSYAGGIWRVSFNWAATGKSNVGVSAWHELHAYVDAESNYFVAQGVSLAPTWTATEKLSFILQTSYEKENFIGNSGSEVTGLFVPGGVNGVAVVPVGVRVDKVNAEQLTLRYVPRDAWVVTVVARHEKRESTQYIFSFNDNVFSGSLTYRFL